MQEEKSFVPERYAGNDEDLAVITAHFAAKAAAIRQHVSQDPERLVTLAERLNSFRAAQSGTTCRT